MKKLKMMLWLYSDEPLLMLLLILELTIAICACYTAAGPLLTYADQMQVFHSLQLDHLLYLKPSDDDIEPESEGVITPVYENFWGLIETDTVEVFPVSEGYLNYFKDAVVFMGDSNANPSENGLCIYLPYQYKNKYSVGDSIEIQPENGGKETVMVAGFLNRKSKMWPDGNWNNLIGQSDDRCLLLVRSEENLPSCIRFSNKYLCRDQILTEVDTTACEITFVDDILANFRDYMKNSVTMPAIIGITALVFALCGMKLYQIRMVVLHRKKYELMHLYGATVRLVRQLKCMNCLIMLAISTAVFLFMEFKIRNLVAWHSMSARILSCGCIWLLCIIETNLPGRDMPLITTKNN